MMLLHLKNLRSRSSRGFTLIELLVTLAIVAILAAIILAVLTGTRNKGNDAKVKAEVTQIKTAVEGYAATNGGYPYAEQGGSNVWCIGASDCKMAGTPITNNTDTWTGDKQDLFPQYPKNIEFTDSGGAINKGYIYVSCTFDQSVNGYCPTDTTYIIYPLTTSVNSTIVGSYTEQKCNPSLPQCQGAGGGEGGGVGTVGTVTFDGGGDGHSWGDPLNWNPDGLPGTSSDVNILAAYSVDGSAPNSIASLTVCCIAVMHTPHLTVIGNSTFDNVRNNIDITGNVSFTSEAGNFAHITGNAFFRNSSGNGGSGIVSGNASFYDDSINYGSVHGNACFANLSANQGTVDGTVTSPCP